MQIMIRLYLIYDGQMRSLSGELNQKVVKALKPCSGFVYRQLIHSLESGQAMVTFKKGKLKSDLKEADILKLVKKVNQEAIG